MQDIHKDIHLLHIFQPVCIILGILCSYKFWMLNVFLQMHIILAMCAIAILSICHIYNKRLLKRMLVYIFCGYIAFQIRIYHVNFQQAYTPKEMMIMATVADINEYQERKMVCSLQLKNIETVESNQCIRLPQNATGFIYTDVNILSELSHTKDLTDTAALISSLAPGVKIVCKVDVLPISQKDIPTDYDARFYAYFNNQPVNFKIKEIHVHSQQSSSYLANFRHYLLKRVSKLHDYDLAQAFLIGSRNNLSIEHRELFQRLGIYHILSISSMHLSAVSLIGYLIGYLLFVLISILGSIPEKFKIVLYKKYPALTLILPPSPRMYSKIIAIVLCIVYTVFTGASIPTIRACMMYMTGFLLLFSDYNTSLLHTLILTCSAILLIYPETILTSSFQFSFMAMYAITLLPKIQLLIKNKLHIRNKYLQYIFQSIITCIFISIYTAPIAMYHFQQITLQPILGNLIIVPYIICIMMPTLFLHIVLPISFLLNFEFYILACLLKILDYTSFIIHTNTIYPLALLLLLILLPFAHSRTKLFRLHIVSIGIMIFVALFPTEKPIMLLDRYGRIGYVKDNILYTTCKIDSYTAKKWQKYFQAQNIEQFKHESSQPLFDYYICSQANQLKCDIDDKKMIDISQCIYTGGLIVYKDHVCKMNDEKFANMNIYLW